ncbi:platelet glycoprotein V [Channa argus]|uniref:platelet glycoprotein V n=1 Tax=Channa argus TaxID=215402 RepID=UPI0035229FAB
MMDSHFRAPLSLMLSLFTLPYLTSLDTCPSSCLCNHIGAVKCVGGSITDIPKQLPVHTYLLVLNDTNITVIPDQSLANKSLLLRFRLTYSHLHTIHPQGFHGSPQLKSIKLSFNNLSSVPAQLFTPLTTLEQLHLDGNLFETIAPGMFKGLAELKELDLSRNRLTSLPSGVFDGLTNLTFLNLGKNSIKKLPPGIFHSLTKLQQLSIYNNVLEVLEAGMFDELVSLEELRINQNQIASLPPQVFWSLRNLRILTLSSNQLQAIPEKSFYNMPKLSKLTIYNNPLLSLPDQLMGEMPEMREFYLFTTKLITVPANLFANMSELLWLNFHLNDKLRELPSDLFCCLPKLQKLSLRSNDLHYLHPQLFSRITTVETLLLNDNKLKSLPENLFQGLGQLLNIDLQNNSLKTLPGDIFLSNTVLRALYLSGNPWDCTCSIRDIAKWIRQNEHVVTDKDDVMCHSPLYHVLRTIGSLNDEDFKLCELLSFKSKSSIQNNLHEPTQPYHSISTSVETSVVASTNTQPGTLPTTQGASQTANIPTTTTPARFLHTVTSAPPKDGFPVIVETNYISSPFHDRLVFEQGPEFIHHSLHKGWVYVWFLPSDTTLAGVLMFCHILLVTTGLFLILAAMYGMYRLSKTMNEQQNKLLGLLH